MKRQVWLLVPTVIVVSAVAEHFSVPWYYEAAAMLVLVVFGSWMLKPHSTQGLALLFTRKCFISADTRQGCSRVVRVPLGCCTGPAEPRFSRTS